MTMAQNEQPRKPFRVLVVGGGIAGLTMSHCLSRANIDHVVLEAYSQIASPKGASIGFWPHGMRILSQIGCANEILDRSVSMQYSHNRLPTGKPVSSTRLWDFIQERHGYEFRALERRLALEILYNNLPDKSKVKAGKKVISIIEHEKGVRLKMEDGSIEEGDIVVGCDGAHSVVRDAMWRTASRISPGLITAQEKESMNVEYTCLIGMAPGIPGLEHSPDMHVTYGNQRTIQIVTQPNATFFLVYRKLAEPLRGSVKCNYTQEDADREAALFANSHVTETVLFRHIYEKRLRSQLVNLEEVVFEHWHHGRLAILGDAAHKITPNFAFGGNSALEDVASFTNSLHKALQNSSSLTDTATLTQPEISTAFQSYQNTQKARIKKLFSTCYYATRMQAWDNVALRFVSQYMAPFFGDEPVANYTATMVKGAVKLDYLPVPDFPDNHVPATWKFDDEKKGEGGRFRFSVPWLRGWISPKPLRI